MDQIRSSSTLSSSAVLPIAQDGCILEVKVHPLQKLQSSHCHTTLVGGLQSDSHLPSDIPTGHSSTATLASCSIEKQERLNVRLASAFVIFFVLGWGDGVTGNLLPYFKADFNLSFMTSSLCFVTSTAGFALGTALVERILALCGWVCISQNSRIFFLPAFLRRRHGHGVVRGFSTSQARFIVTFAGTLLHPLFFIIMGCRKNFASMLVAYVISAFARSLLTATMNNYVASTPKKALGYMYGYWSIGSMCAPLVCQSVVATGVPWNRFYFGSLVLSGISSAFAFWAFLPSSAEIQREVLQGQERARGAEETVEQTKDVKLPGTPDSEATVGFHELSPNDVSAPSKTLVKALKVPILWILVTFLGLYIGTEAGTQGFIVTYLLGVRNANTKTVGYSTSGFWGGQALSRFVWGYINLREDGPFNCASISLIFQLTIWFVDSFIENCFATAFLGLLYGPMYVDGLAIVKELLPEDLHMISMQIGASFGSFGAALFPFLIGVAMNYGGPKTMIYMVFGQTAAMMVLWFILPSKPRY
ncbi:major facilitator superfamily domain-containing protein [Irpex lacteus]|nr:major facilitator superfamily domain-containing protein [Irpex lacteus]